jgi:sugar phosphate isomerase/epimerase
MNPTRQLKGKTMNQLNRTLSRRSMIQYSSMGLASIALASPLQAAADSKVKFFKCLGPGHIGVSGNQEQIIHMAAKFGFGGVDPSWNEIAKMSEQQRKDIYALLQEKNLRWGAAGLPVDFRRDEDRFQKDIAMLPERAKAMQQANVTRASTWIMPGTNDLTYLENFKQHKTRLKQACEIFQDHKIRLGLEFVGPRTTRRRFRFTFVNTQKEMLELCDAIGTDNVGLLFDAWHWHTSHGTIEEMEQLTNNQIVNVHVNDAPVGIPIDELIDSRRALPTTTGVMNLKGFINTLVKIGYDGPVECEPFDNTLKAMDNEPALQKTINSLNELWKLIK